MRVLIVDDEPKVRQHLQSLFLSRDGDEIVGEACDGVEALKMLDAVLPDIIITDIRMPRMDGLQLLQEVQRLGFIVGQIVLTGYGDFTYTQRAMQQGIRTYLLKPIDEAELWLALEEAKKELAHEKLVRHQLKRGEMERRELQLHRLLQSHSPAGEALTAPFAPGSPGHLFVIEILEEDVQDHAGVMERLQNETTVITAVDETRMACWQRGCANPAQEAERLRTTFLDGNRQVTVAYGESLSSPLLIGKSYQDICGLLNSRWLLPQCAILHTGMLPHVEKNSLWESVQLWNHAPLDEAIQANNAQAIRTQADGLFRLLQGLPCDEQVKRTMFTEELIHIMRGVSEKGGDTSQVLGDGFNVLELLKTHNIAGMQSWYYSICLKVAQYLADIRKKRPSCVSEKIVSLFQKDPAGSYSLNELARMFYMSPTYLGAVFKKEKGETLHAWLTAERLRLAKAALLQSDAPVYEIAEQCGYQNLRSFFAAFKKNENCTPSAYRERVKNK